METERLVIRAWTPDDAEDAFRMYGDPEVVKFLTGVVEESVETQRALLQRIAAAYGLIGRGFGSFATVSKETERVIGCAMLKPLPRSEDWTAWVEFRDGLATEAGVRALPPVHEIEVGWHLARSAWGSGFATESARRMMQYGFDELGLEEVSAVVFKDNRRSVKVAERIGMTKVGPTDRFYGLELDLYRMDREDWEAL